MDRLRIKGGRQLKGEIRISGSKNASLPLMVAALLTDRKLTLHNVPRLADISTMIQLLKQHGVEVGAGPGENGHDRGTTLTLQAGKIASTTAPYDIVRKMRASVLVLGPLPPARPLCVRAAAVRFTDADVDQARAAGVLIEFERGRPIIVDRCMYRELVKGDQAHPRRPADQGRRRGAGEEGLARSSKTPEVRLTAAKRSRDAQLRELTDQAHGANLDLGRALRCAAWPRSTRRTSTSPGSSSCLTSA